MRATRTATAEIQRVNTPVILLQIAAILVAGRVFAEVAARLNTPRVIGEMAAGIVLGPSLLALIEPNDVIRLLAEIGIILLLFEVGLDTDFSRLVKSGARGVAVALAGFMVPAALTYGLCRYTFDLSLLTALFAAGTVTATSIGVTIRILTDLGRQSSSEGQIVLGAAIIDDVLGVIVLAILYDFSVRGNVSLAHAGRIVLLVCAFFVLAPILATLLSGLIRRFHAMSEAPGLVPVALVSLVLAFAALAHALGAPELLGGFAAGIALSRRFFLPFSIGLRVDPAFNRVIREQMHPIIQLFTPIFFVMVGLSLDLGAVDWTSPFIWSFSLLVTVAAIAGKLVGGLVVPENHHARIAIGMAMVPRGEVGLIFAEVGRVSGVFDDAVYTGMVIVITYTTLLSPFWIRLYYRRYGHLFADPDQGHDYQV